MDIAKDVSEIIKQTNNLMVNNDKYMNSKINGFNLIYKFKNYNTYIK